MCGRYAILTSKQQAEIIQIIKDIEKNYKDSNIKTGEIFPTNQAPIILGVNDELHAEPMGWGFPNFRNKGVVINARAETVQEKSMFAKSLHTRRCIIPASGFYEWKQNTTKQKYFFTMPNDQVLYMAGLWNEFNAEKRFVILTTQPNESIADIHNRMPLVLEKEQINNWVMDTEAAIKGQSRILCKLHSGIKQSKIYYGGVSQNLAYTLSYILAKSGRHVKGGAAAVVLPLAWCLVFAIRAADQQRKFQVANEFDPNLSACLSISL